jgi:hypothetical protein
LDGEIDDGGRPAMRAAIRAGAKVIRRGRPAEWQLHVRMRIDATGMTYLPAASMVTSASISSFAPIVVIVSPSMKMSAL